MDIHAHQSLHKRIFRGISRFIITNTRGKIHEQPVSQAGHYSETLVDHPNVPSLHSVVPQEPDSQADSSVLVLSVPSSSVQSLMEYLTHDSTTDPLAVTLSDGQAVENNKVLAAPLNHSSAMTFETTKDVTSWLKPVQTVKIFSKAFLGLLSSATEGVPVPGVKAIFDTIIKVIGAIEVSTCKLLPEHTDQI